MKKMVLVLVVLFVVLSYGDGPKSLQAAAPSQNASARDADNATLRVILLGTAGGPTFSADRLGIATLVVAGTEKLLFDCGRGVTTGLARMGINPVDVTKVFLTHLHSDHIISVPELYLYPWASQVRSVPLQIWGPDGTRSMMEHLQKAFEFDIHIRRDVDEKFSPDGIKVRATDIQQGVVHEANGVKVTAFLVDHGPVKPAFGYRIDYRGHSIVLSGDTKPSDNLVKFSQGVDVLVHEVGRSKQDPALSGPPNERIPGGFQTRQQARTLADHHTDPAEAGQVFQRVKPKLALFSHYNLAPAAVLPLVKQSYGGPVEFGEDLMTIEIGDKIDVRRLNSKGN
jgi:ribonuclease Z